MEITVVDLLSKMTVAIPTIMGATLLLTSTIKGIFNLKKDWVKQLLSWIISIGTALIFVACNQLTFNVGCWDYAVAAVCGFITGLSTNEIYSWKKIKARLDALTELFKKD